ncbi:AcvB/VirJ family lysyl-phosphatidylglycerol hydrolase [Labrys monachus]|uniref:Type IV secretory pathway VirJ component n=1 Tax=Labrys monachus TaxID=217067 RepID=A0ABU0FPB1_9HYPH|nr:AcvB/VirJ family lysyl-phosphatidylglycerol hydrolase [Labrys monachus]MDQ0395939.1 type IV secretory pathway VirJ component [Labrys monachus]
MAERQGAETSRLRGLPVRPLLQAQRSHGRTGRPRTRGKILLAALLACLALASPGRAGTADPPAGLPIAIYPASGRPLGLVVLLSGDGGWQAIDRALARRFAAAGFGVVGLDSLDYFFARKTPERLAADLDRIADAYRQAWGVRRIAFVGYSFGADAFPFAWPHLAARTRRATRLVALLGLVPAADFRISILEMLDIPSADDVPVGPALRSLPMDKVICLYGVEERAAGNTACTLPELGRATRIERRGGHHFDGDYAGIARIILRRLGAASRSGMR